MLVHICCSVDCDYFFKRLKAQYPNEKLVGYFYDPNIHPYGEFLLRFEDVRRVCKKYDVKLICGEYDYEAWLEGARGLENEPEKGERCSFCFDFRFVSAAKLAKKLGENIITTTLLMSPKKSFSQLVSSMQKICDEFGLGFVAPDFRKGGGTAEQMALARSDKLYRQNYCGCFFALNSSNLNCEKRENFELTEPLGAQIQPSGVLDRFKLFRKIAKLEKKGVKFELIREKFLNYRLKFASVKSSNLANSNLNFSVVPSYFLFYSHLPRKISRFGVEKSCEIFRAPKDEIVLLSLEKFNSLGGFKFESVSELISNPPKLKRELKVRKKLTGDYSLAPIIVLDTIKASKIEVFCEAVIFVNTRERLEI